MNHALKIITVVFTMLLVVFFIIISFHKETEITNAGLIPKVFDAKTTILPSPQAKQLERKNLVESVVSNKTIYLTFDDGPSYLTMEILDILKQEKVAATFFIVGTNVDKYKEVVKRAYVDGHTIAMHTNTHKYNEIYSSLDNYFNDLKIVKNKIYNLTGVSPRIVRFPGGSSNMVSKKYSKGIMTNIVNKINSKSYYYFDWNIDSGDASGKLNKDAIYNNVVTHLNYDTNIVLMHDAGTKLSTVQALPQIIKYGKEHGYTFARITKDTRPIHHKINN